MSLSALWGDCSVPVPFSLSDVPAVTHSYKFVICDLNIAKLLFNASYHEAKANVLEYRLNFATFSIWCKQLSIMLKQWITQMWKDDICFYIAYSKYFIKLVYILVFSYCYFAKYCRSIRNNNIKYISPTCNKTFNSLSESL